MDACLQVLGLLARSICFRTLVWVSIEHPGTVLFFSPTQSLHVCIHACVHLLYMYTRISVHRVCTRRSAETRGRHSGLGMTRTTVDLP